MLGLIIFDPAAKIKEIEKRGDIFERLHRLSLLIGLGLSVG
jgi:hypothetical protein